MDTELFYLNYMQSRYFLHFSEIAALHKVEPECYGLVHAWFKARVEALITLTNSSEQRETWLKLLQEQPEYQRARELVENLKLQSRGY